MPREAARRRFQQSPVFRHFSPDSHVFPHPGGSADGAVEHTSGVLMRLSGLLPAFLRVERHLLFTCPEKCGMQPSPDKRASTRRVRRF